MKIVEVIDSKLDFNSVEDLSMYLWKDCKQWFNECGGWDEAFRNPLYRGAKRIVEPVVYFPPRTHRRPTDMDPHVSNEIDDIFKMHFGGRFRSEGYFATGAMMEAMGYGTVYYCFPAGDFKFCWSPEYEDMYMSYRMFRDEDRQNYADNGGDLDYYDEADCIRRFVDKGNYQTSDLHDAIQSGNEIMFISNGFYLIDRELFKSTETNLYFEWCKAL